ncbi:hypothetical protein IL252_13765 [Halomicrobium sp. IBSBa]|uniref:O-antigen ligase family protein n=1 Tax=Halomicrobium sp. IBSBa TaxID=2778916 RepID=UPI001ABF947E|nr:O-antigen ligase family protein [Halomicrobium sp. IBSBa]MBO4248884.1 hypothetical protein [Halomicrobium sp. IBSBa]
MARAFKGIIPPYDTDAHDTFVDLFGLSIVEHLSMIVLCLLALSYPILWLPGIHPSLVGTLKTGLLLLYVGLRGFVHLRTHKVEIIWPSVSIAFAAVLFTLVAYWYKTHILILVFGYACALHVYRRPEIAKRIVHLFTIWMTLLSVYAMLVHYMPIPGFEPIVYPGTPHETFVERFGNPNLVPNSFGFYNGNATPVPVSIAFVFSIAYARKSSYYYLPTLILLTYLFVLVDITGGHGRVGLVLPVFVLIVLLLEKLRLEQLLPVAVFSPLFLWIGIFIMTTVWEPVGFVYWLDDFMSSRISLYMDSIRVLLRNSWAPIGIGPAPWGEYTYAELGVGVETAPLSFYDPKLTRSHNLAFEYLIEYGFVSGGMLFYLCWKLSSKTADLLCDDSPTLWGVSIVVVGSVFGGVTAGQLGPFPTMDPSMIFWWLCFGVFIGLVAKRSRSPSKKCQIQTPNR